MRETLKRMMGLFLAFLILMDVFTPLVAYANVNRQGPGANFKNSQRIQDQNYPEITDLKKEEESSGRSHDKGLLIKDQNVSTYTSWRLKSPRKLRFKEGEKLNLGGLWIEATDTRGEIKYLNYDQVLADENISVRDNIRSKNSLKKGNSSLTISTPGLADIVIEIEVGDLENSALKENENQNPNPIKDKNKSIVEENNEIGENLQKDIKNEKKIEAGKEENKEEAGKEEKDGILDKIKETLGITGLQKADKELKKALADEKNGIKEIQALLDTFEEKYELSREDQEKLMADNDAAIKRLVEKDRNENFRPDLFVDANGLNLEGKKFHIITRFDTSNAGGPIQPYQYFYIHLDNKLTVNNPAELKPIMYQGRVIAIPEYIEKENKIKYQIQGTIPENIQLPLDIPVDYNTNNISLDPDGTFTVTNKVSGLGVKAPKDLVPQKIDKNGNFAGSIIEPGRHDVTQIMEADAFNYRVYIGGRGGTPRYQNGELEGFDWNITVESTFQDLKSLNFAANFTTVKGSGLGEIQDLKINGQASSEVTDNDIKGKFGIVDSKNYKATTAGVRKFTYTFFTPKTNTQEEYVLDLSAIANNKPGATRLIAHDNYSKEKIDQATPTRVGVNNRTTIMGQFTSEDTSLWTVTDAVSTGDDKGQNALKGLPLADRNLTDQTVTSSNMAVYVMDTVVTSPTYGKMVIKPQTSAPTNLGTQIPAKETNPEGTPSVGTIAVYEYGANLIPSSPQKPSVYSLGGVVISKNTNIYLDQNWSIPDGFNMPAQYIEAKDPQGNVIGSVNVAEATDPSLRRRQIIIYDVKVWNIVKNGTETKANRIVPKVVQDLPKILKDGDKTYKYLENYNYYTSLNNEYFIHNIMTKDITAKLASFTLKKVDENGKPLGKARFRLFKGPEVETDLVTGEAQFSNIPAGSYSLIETKAPEGYKLGEDIYFTVDLEGRINKTSGPGTIEGGVTPTTTIENQQWPSYMNAMHYGKKDAEGNIESYIFLKALGNKTGGTTDRDTRVDIKQTGISNLQVEVFDVDPADRNYIRSQMNLQATTSNGLNPVLNIENNNPIKGWVTSENGYSVRFPLSRFGGAKDWGFLVKITGKATGTSSLSYDWVTDDDPGQASLKNNSINLSSSTSKQTVITVKNEPFTKKPIEVIKVDSAQQPLAGATFVLRDVNGDPIATKISGTDGKATFGEYPEGTYTIEEQSSPDNYIESQVIFDVKVDKAGQVTYSARNKNGQGSPTNGQDYWIKNEEVTDTSNKAEIVTVDQSMSLKEGQAGGLSSKAGVWEAYRYESYTYHAIIDLKQTQPGKRFEIQFDPNLDLTQYVNEFPSIKEKGKVIGKPYFDYDTNLLTYVFTKDSSGGEVKFDLTILGIIPSKFYAKTDGNYTFTVDVGPNLPPEKVKGNKHLSFDVKADYSVYDNREFSAPAQAYYFRDVYKKGNDWYVKAIAYYNPTARTSGGRTLSFNWMSTDWRGDMNMLYWPGVGISPAFGLDEVKIYRVLPSYGYDPGNSAYKLTSSMYMPLSMGVKPENDPNTYSLVFSSYIDSRYSKNDYQNGIRLSYDPGLFRYSKTDNLMSATPLKIQMPAISGQKEGYVIEQNFKVTDLNKFRNRFRAFYMYNGGNMKSSFASKVNTNEAAAEQNKREIPKFYSQIVKMANQMYNPGHFKIIKKDESDSTKKLADAEFALKDSQGITIYRSSDTNGEVPFTDLKPGVYTLTETKAPKDYINASKTWQVSVAMDGTVTITEIGLNADDTTLVGKDITLPVNNKPAGQEFRVYKKGEDNKPLEGASFTVKKKGEDKVYTSGTSNGQGVVTFDRKLENGTYILEESAAPTGYKKLDDKWVLVVDSKGVKVYSYIEGPSGQAGKTNTSLLNEKDTKWVNVADRPVANFNGLTDPRWRGYLDNSVTPYKVGTRIIGINKANNYVIQRYVLNPEGKHIGKSKAQIYREPLTENNMTWYAGNEDIKAFRLDKPVKEYVEDIKLDNYSFEELNVTKRTVEKPGEAPKRVEIDIPETDKPIIIDVKIPYKNLEGSIGTGIDYFENYGTPEQKVYWKPDYYDKVSEIPEGELVNTGNDQTQGGNIIGSYISEGSLDVTNNRNKHEFEFKKIREKTTDAVSGATFYLEKTDKPAQNTKWEKSGADGKVHFKDLLPGKYKLVEHGAAQGYDLANTDWTVTILEDGKVYIKDNNGSNTVTDNNPEHKWQKVNVEGGTKENKSVSQNKDFENRPKEKLDTNIVEVNQITHRMRQVYILNKSTENLNNPSLQIHSQPENRDITNANTKVVSINEVQSNSTPNNLVRVGDSVPFKAEQLFVNGHNRLKVDTSVVGEKTLAVTIETDLPQSGAIGTGMDFVNFGNKYWAAESYESLDDFMLEILSDQKVGKNSGLIVGKEEPIKDLTTRSAKGQEESQYGPLYKIRTTYLAPRTFTLSYNLMKSATRGSDWEAVDPDKSSGRANIKHNESLVETKITEINKGQKRFKQVFLYKEETASKDRLIEIHRQPENAELRLGYSADIETYVNVYKVDASSIDQALNASKTKINVSVKQKEATSGKPRRIQVEVPAAHRGYILVEVEAKYTGAVGLGSDYYPNRNQQYDKTVQWVGDSYSSDSSINDKTQITYEYGYEEEIIPITYATQSDPNMDEGQTRVEKGQEGKKRVYYKYEVSNGKRTGRKFIDTGHGNNGVEIITPMKPEITYRGTRKPQPQEPTYDITVYGYIYNGKVIPNKTKAKAGEEVTLTIKPDSGYELKTLYYNDEITGDDIPITNYKFIMPKSNVRINATFGPKNQPQPKKYNINTSVTGNVGGSVTANPTSQEEGKDVTITVTPQAGYVIQKVTLNKTNITAQFNNSSTYTFPMGHEDANIVATFTQTGQYNINILPTTNGSVTTDHNTAKAGDSVLLTFHPDPGYEVDRLLINGDEYTVTNNGFRFEMPDYSINVQATFKAKEEYFDINTDQTDGGWVSVDKTRAKKGDEVTITVQVHNGYELGQVTANGKPILLQDGKYTFTMPAYKVNVSATFIKKEVKPKAYYYVGYDPNNDRYTVNIKGLKNGKAESGSKVEFSVSPKLGYDITKTYVKTKNGITIPTQFDTNTGQGSFTMPDFNATIYVRYTKHQPQQGEHAVFVDGGIVGGNVYLEVNQTKGGKNKPILAKTGDKVRIKIEKWSKEYRYIGCWVSDGNPGGGVPVQNDSQGLYFMMPDKDVSVSANFTKQKVGNYEVNISQSEHGSVTARPTSANEKDLITLEARPDVGYKLASLTVKDVNGKKIEVSNNSFSMPASNVSIEATFIGEDEPLPGDPGSGQTLPDDAELGYLIYDPVNKKQKNLSITNKPAGLELNIYKKDPLGSPLQGGEFTLTRVDESYENPIGNLTLTGISTNEGKIIFRDGKGNVAKLEKGYYILKETKPPLGYKKATSDWKIEVKDDQGRMHAAYYGPKKTANEFLRDDTLAKFNDTMNSNKSIKTASRITHIDPVAKTFVQRTVIDLRNYSDDKLNVQISPKYKRGETDFVPDKVHGIRPPNTNDEGLKTAYRTTYKIANPPGDINIDNVLQYYDLSNKKVSMVNTARWRPFDWGFDEDQLNLEPGGLYFIDVEGYYDEALLTGIAKNEKDKNGNIKPAHTRTDISQDDLGKLQMDFKLYKGAREFQQAVYNDKTKDIEWKAFHKASYQAGAQAIAKTQSPGWAGEYDKNGKYQNWLGKDGGRIWPELKGTVEEEISTAPDISQLYTTTKKTDVPVEIPKTGLDLVNEEESYNITFSKHGRDGEGEAWSNDSENVTTNRLEGAIFKLQQEVQGSFVDMPGSYVSSAFNGYFGFRGLKPGRYRLMEVQAPPGYRPIYDPILHMTISYEKPTTNAQGEITPGRGSITLEYDNSNGIVQYEPERGGKLVDFVTSATAKNMGKIINEKPGKGKVTLVKKDEQSQLINGAKFKLTRLGVKKDENDQNSKNKFTYTGTVGTKNSDKIEAKDGELVFDQLPIGNYELEEVTPAPGHKLTGQRWYFTVGGKDLDPYAGAIERTGVDQSKNITLTTEMTIKRPDKNDTTTDDGTIYPNKAQMLNFATTFKIDSKTTISPGDFFTVKLTDNMDLKGIFKKKKVEGLDIFADGVGTIAKADYNEAAGEITYTFTDYARTYKLLEFNANYIAHIDADKIKKSENNLSVGPSIKGGADTTKQINVFYDRGVTNSGKNYNGDQVSMSSKITEFNPDTGEFTQIFYINPSRNNAGFDYDGNSIPTYFNYYPGKGVDDLRISAYWYDNSSYNDYDYTNTFLNEKMPASYGLDLSKETLWNTKFYGRTVTDYNNGWMKFSRMNKTDSYVVKVTGRIADGQDKTSFTPRANLINYKGGGGIRLGVKRYDAVYSNKSDATAKADLTISAINPKNEIVFKKIDQNKDVLKGAEFKLLRKTTQNAEGWEDAKDANGNLLTATSGEDGLFKFETLPEGTYALVETKAPDGYTRIDRHIEEFMVTQTGIIKLKVKADETANTTKTKAIKAVKAFKALFQDKAEMGAENKVDTNPVQGQDKSEYKVIGTDPIEVINYKDIDFVKIDALDKNRLRGAEFKLWYKENEKDEYEPIDMNVYKNLIVYGKDKNGELDGSFKIHVTKAGYYALEETKAPAGYTKMPGFIRELKLGDGKVQVLEKDPLRASHRVSDRGMLESEILEVDEKNNIFKQRVIINPDHTSWKFDSTSTIFGIEAKDWQVPNQKIKYAVLDKEKKIEDLEYKEIQAGSGQGNTISYFQISQMLKDGDYTSSQETVDGKESTFYTTEKAIVLEITGKPNDGSKANLHYDLKDGVKILGHLIYSYDKKNFGKDTKPTYVDKPKLRAIEVENKKAIYPRTGGIGTLIFTGLGLSLMGLALLTYKRRRIDHE
ncbi:LPXTG-motif protein cell wall anchor domain protein [Clostridiales bacterium KA00134]|nr:LPXTG-motif protein cell wall anchor domain protein [Clostridiales bacterium KA00134]